MEGQLVQNIADVLSTLTILSCLFLKVPQIMFIREKRSAEGIFIQAMLMEVVGFSIMTLYNYTNHYSLMTYMEYPIILTQVYVMFYYVLKYKKLLDEPSVTLGTMAYILIVLGFVSEIFPKSILTFFVPLCTPLSGFAKVTYIYGIIKAANADTISLTTWVISVLTNISRIFTVYVDSADINLISNFSVSALLSSGVLLTALAYQRKPGSRRSLSRSRRQSRKSN